MCGGKREKWNVAIAIIISKIKSVILKYEKKKVSVKPEQQFLSNKEPAVLDNWEV